MLQVHVPAARAPDRSDCTSFSLEAGFYCYATAATRLMKVWQMRSRLKASHPVWIGTSTRPEPWKLEIQLSTSITTSLFGQTRLYCLGFTLGGRLFFSFLVSRAKRSTQSGQARWPAGARTLLPSDNAREDVQLTSLRETKQALKYMEELVLDATIQLWAAKRAQLRTRHCYRSSLKI